MKRKRTSPPLSTAEITQLALEDHRRLLSPADFDLLLQELERPLISAIRTNPLKAGPQAIQDWAKTYGWQIRPVPYCPTGWWIPEALTAPAQPIEHRLGYYYIQDAASMLPVELFDLQPDPNQLILDMAASPGGKTTHLLSRSGDQSLVVANDSSLDRVTALRLVLQTWGAANTAVTSFPGEKFGGWFPETFDRILLDAPCSMQNLRSTDAHPMRPISTKERASLAQRQTRLLGSAFQALKTGGQLVYATCTLAPEEDEAVLDNLIQLYGTAVQIVNLDKKLPAPAPALSGDGNRSYHPSVTHAARLYPHRFGTSGFFCALLTKTEPVDNPGYTLPLRDLGRTGLERLRHRDSVALCDQLQQAFGYDYTPQMAAQRLALWQRNEQFFILPETWIQHFAEIPFQAVGLLLGENSPDGLIPSHEWLTRFAPQFERGRVTLNDTQSAAWMRGEDIQASFDAPQLASRIVAVFDEQERLLGRGRVFTSRLKNMLPRRVIY